MFFFYRNYAPLLFPQENQGANDDPFNLVDESKSATDESYPFRMKYPGDQIIFHFRTYRDDVENVCDFGLSMQINMGMPHEMTTLRGSPGFKVPFNNDFHLNIDADVIFTDESLRTFTALR